MNGRGGVSFVGNLTNWTSEATGGSLIYDEPGDSRSGQSRSALLLTPRELQVLSAIGNGLSNRKVGRSLGISECTVKVHLHSIFIKLGAGSRTEAVIQGIRNGYITV